jgi:hypothetical protein
MDDAKKMLRTIINGQSAMKSELLIEIRKVDKKVDGLEKKVNDGFKNVGFEFKKVNERIDKLGKSLAYLEDDAPTVGEFDKLERRITKIEQKVVSI